MPRRNEPRQLLTISLKVQFGGETGIRTLETLAGLTVFKTAAIDRSAISPLYLRARPRSVALDFRASSLRPARSRCALADL